MFHLKEPKVIHAEVGGFETTSDAGWLRNMDRFERFMELPEDQRAAILDAVADLMLTVRSMGAMLAFEVVCAVIEANNEGDV
jgi:hypothetical protein